LNEKDEQNEITADRINRKESLTNDPDDDIFKLLDDTLTNKAREEKTQNKTIDSKKESEPLESIVQPQKIDNDLDLEFEEDDEVDFLKPFFIQLETKSKQDLDDSRLNNSKKSDDLLDAWRYGPASYWYEINDPSSYLLKKPEVKETKTSAATTDETDLKKIKEEDEEEEEDEPKKEMSQEPDTISSECETLNLTQVVNKLNDLTKDEKFLLVNTTNWEDNIIFDFNQKLSTAELINERIKYAGWVPSSEHRSLLSYQSKILGKKVDFLESYKDQAVPVSQTTSHSGKHHHHHHHHHNHHHNTTQANAANQNWLSIFPNENYEFIYGDWEKKIILDPKNIDTSLLNPPEFLIDPNDDNLLLGVPEDPSLAQTATSLNAQNAENDANKNKENEDQLTQKQKDKNKIYESRNKITKSLLGRTGVIKEDSNNNNNNENNNENSETKSNETKNFWNISNDEFYNPKVITEQQQQQVSKNVSTTLVLQHSQAALELRQPFFPTHLSAQKLRNFHRYSLKRYLNGVLSNEQMFYPVSCLLKKGYHLNKKSTSLSAAISAATQLHGSSSTNTTISTNELVSIQNANDLSASDNCELVLAEYSEQFPPLMLQPGMATKIRNYYKRKFAKDEGTNLQTNYGELVYINSSPFLGSLKPGEFLQSLENYMFRAPIYMHKMPEQDFLLIRNRQSGYFIRGDFKAIFVVGQECPLIEVPGPNSKRANSFIKDFLQAFILRLFHRSREIPKRIRFEDVKRAFPTHTESSIRKRLKLCSDFRRNGKTDANWWILKEEVRLPTEEEIRTMVSPEQCCAFYSMCAAEQRLKDAGYGEKNLFASDDDDVDNIKIDDEVKNAPWHTTRAYLDANKGKCLLSINGVADPTGRGEGFSYVRQPFKPNKNDEEGGGGNESTKGNNNNTSEIVASPQPQANSGGGGAGAAANTAKKTVTGTDADLRRLHLSQAKELLASYGVPDHEIKKLKRWEIIDVVRTMSTQKAKEGNGAAVSKFARGNRYTQSDAHEKFREECQRLFELQNRNLASEEFLSTDDDEDLDEDSDVDEMGKNLESMLQSKLSTNDTNNNNNSKNNQTNSNKPMDSSTELKNLIMNQSNRNNNNNNNNNNNTDSNLNDSKSLKNQQVPPNMHRVLRITRTYRDEETGQEYTKVETVKKPLIIDAYVKIRTTKDDEFIKSAFALDEDEKEKLRKERRRLQEQLRRVKRNEAKRAKNDDESPDGGSGTTTGKKEVRKYTKSGLARKPKNMKKQQMIMGENGQLIPSTESTLKRTYTKSSIHFSSGDEDKSMHFGAGGDQTGGDQSQSNILDTTASSLNNTLTNNPLGVVKKRKYIKRKKPEIGPDGLPIQPPATNQTNNESGGAISKVEGTKLIIQKKAIKLALNNSEVNPDGSLIFGGGMNTSGLDPNNMQPVKKPRVSKKMLKQQLGSNLMVVDTSGTNLDTSANLNDSNADPNASLQAPKLKIINKNKLNKPSLILHIPKEKLGMSTQQQQQSTTDGNNSGTSNSMANSPSVVDVTSVNTNEQISSPFLQQQQQQQQPKRQYNKQNSMIKKQQKLMLQQQQQHQQFELQLKLQMSQNNPFAAAAAAANNLPFSAAAALTAVSQFTNIFEQQQLMMALQQQMQQQQQQLNQQSPNLNKQFSSQSSNMSGNTPNSMGQVKRKSSTQSNAQLDYLVKPHKKVDRRHADPLVSFSSILENILNEVRDFPDAQPFLIPVNSKKVVDYYSLVKNPVDLQTIRKRIIEKAYKDRESFLDDMRLLVENSALYNGSNHPITASAENLYILCQQKMEEKQDKLIRLEKAINPLLDDNSVIAFNYMLDQIFESNIMTVENSFSFLKPVNKGKYKDYYDIIKNPINLEEIKAKINSKKYKSREEFCFDFELLFNNCLTYNGLNNSYTNTAQKLLNACKKACNSDFKEQLKQLEETIQISLMQDNNNYEENSQGVTYSMDSESNLANSVFNENEMYEVQPSTSSSSAAMMTPNFQLNKKPKLINKNSNSKLITNNNNNKVSNRSSSGGENTGNILTSTKLKNKQFFFASMPSNKNSPRSGSDAEVFVDVESIDDRGFSFGKQKTSINKSHNFEEEQINEEYEEDDDQMDNYQDYQ
jgi:hypothetical protein